MPMPSRHLLALAAFLLLAGACAIVPFTKRSQLMLISQPEMLQLGAQAYQQVLKEGKVAGDPALNSAVRSIGQRIAAVAEQPDFKWEFTVLRADDTVNAFALPGGKTAVYTGLFPIAETDAGMATVLGHEIAHAVARHAAERMSQGVLLQLGAAGLGAALGGNNPTARNAIMQALGLGAQVGVILPFDRQQESEADHIGLILMAKAGYDPQAALGLWDRMEAASKGQQPAEFLSTHPSYGTRREQIRAWLPEAQRYYQPSKATPNRHLPPIH